MYAPGEEEEYPGEKKEEYPGEREEEYAGDEVGRLGTRWENCPADEVGVCPTDEVEEYH